MGSAKDVRQNMQQSIPQTTHRVPRRIAWTYACIRLFLGPIVRAIWIRRLVGVEHIPRHGAVILAATHESYFDFICTIAIARRNVYYLAAEKFFSNPRWRTIMRITGQVEVDRQHKENRQHIDSVVLGLLRSGAAVGIFPEGTRAPTPDEMLQGYPGVVRYAMTANVPIIPIGIRGAFDVMSRFDKRPKFKKIIDMTIGAPIRYDTSAAETITEEVVRRNLADLMLTLAALSGKRYPYADRA